VTIKFTTHISENIPNIFSLFFFSFFFFPLYKEGKARVEKAVQKRYLNPCYYLNALQSLSVTEQLEIEKAVLKIYALHMWQMDLKHIKMFLLPERKAYHKLR